MVHRQDTSVEKNVASTLERSQISVISFCAVGARAGASGCFADWRDEAGRATSPIETQGSFTTGGLVAKKTELEAKKTVLDTTSGQKHFEAIKAEILALKEADLLQPNVDLEKFAMATLSIVDRANESALRARFDSLPTEEFAKGTIEALERAAQATLHVAIKVRTESAGTTKVKVDPALMQEAIEKREVMLRVIAYNLSHLASVMADAEDIRTGTGYLDAASDLSRTSAIYTEHAADLEGDTKFYDPADAAEALSLIHI